VIGENGGMREVADIEIKKQNERRKISVDGKITNLPLASGPRGAKNSSGPIFIV